MDSTELAHLRLHRAPLVVGVVTEPATIERIVSSPPSPCPYDAVELRLDFFSREEQYSDGWLSFCRGLEEAGIPVILTVRLAGEGGRWKGSAAARRGLFARGLGKVSAIDVELASPLLPEVRRMIPRNSTKIIGSYHNFSSTPSFSDIRLVVSDARKDGVDIAKIATTITGLADIHTLREYLDRKRSYPLCIIGMGPRGAETRISFPALGSLLAYGYIDEPTAPGQFSCVELDARLRERIPSYRARKEGR